jgi:dTDP-glucose 4,6-dehydratase
VTATRRYAVLGSNSFAGAAFVAHALAQGGEVLGFNRSPEGSAIFLPYRSLANSGGYRFVQSDVNRDLEFILSEIENFRPQFVVDFAGQGMVAESWQDPVQWYRTNILAKAALHDRLRRFDWLERYLRVSTPEVYGSQSELIRESAFYRPSTPYAVSHAATDMSLRAFHDHYGFPAITARFANFFGPGQQLYRIVPRTIIYALTARRLQLHGGGSAVRAFIHARDVAVAILLCLEKGVPGEIYHFSPQRFVTIRQLVEHICARMGVAFADLVEEAPDRPAKDHAYLMDADRARRELGWTESLSLEQGIEETIDWVRSNLDEIRSLPLDYIHKP